MRLEYFSASKTTACIKKSNPGETDMIQPQNTIRSVCLFAMLGMLVMVTGCAEQKGFRQKNAALSKQRKKKEELPPVITVENKQCVSCHRNYAPALVLEWERSRHAQHGVGCVNCHKANPGEVDAWQHEGALIATLVTPKDCAR